MTSREALMQGRWSKLMRSARARLRQLLRRNAQGREPEAAPHQTNTEQSRRCASVIIPALNEAAAIAGVIASALEDPATLEVIVIDDSSTDDTAAIARASGAKVITSSMLGKGASMSDGVAAATSEFLVYLDGDLRGLRPNIVSELLQPLVDDTADFVKAKFGRSGGRVTELTAKPMLNVFFPELTAIAQPLGGIIAARRSLLKTFEFEIGYGVDIGLLVDAHLSGARIAQIDIGSIEHDPQPLRDLSVMANEVSRVIFSRAKSAGRLHVEQIAAMYEAQRQATAGIEFGLSRRRGRSRLLLVDVDCVTTSPLTRAFAQSTGNERALDMAIQSTRKQTREQIEAIAAAFKFVHKKTLEKIATEVPLSDGVIEFVNQARRCGFMVVLFTDSFFVGAEIVRRRVFADFAAAHILQFESEVCSGRVSINPAFMPWHAPTSLSTISVSNMVDYFVEDGPAGPLELIWTVSKTPQTVATHGRATRAFLMLDSDARIPASADMALVDSFQTLTGMLNAPEQRDIRPHSPSSASLQAA